MSGDRVSYMYQRDPSIDRRYRPRPNKCRDLYKEIKEDEELENIAPNGSSMSSACSQSSDTIDTTASVFLRMRPIKKSCKHFETEDNLLKVIPIENATSTNKDLTEKHFEFSKIFHDQASQLDVYNETVHSSVLNNESLTMLTYGTSGSGKTYTMYGSEMEAGIVQRAIAHIFTANEKIICRVPAAKLDKGNFAVLSEDNIQTETALLAQFKRDDASKNEQMLESIRAIHDFEIAKSQWQYAFVWISFAEIYNENVYDLLKPHNATTKRKNLKIIANDGNSYIKDLTSVYVASASDAYDVINSGLQHVNYASTAINANSSRSHCILQLNVIHFSYPDLYSLATYKFCDLAGSERLKKTENIGERLKEAQRINTSLMVLGRCFDLMFQNQQSKSREVVPFRDSKLTMLLQKSLLGHEKISTVVTMAPKIDFMEENLQVLAFASIAQQIVYKQPKPQPNNHRSTRFSLLSSFINVEKRNDNDWNDIMTENERLENELMDIKEERDQLLDVIQRMTSDHAKNEQNLRNKLVEERETMMNTAKDKFEKRLAYEESKSQRRV